MPAATTIRDRTTADLPELVRLLGDQQAGSGYPMRWPLPFPAEDFIVRPGELGAWVAVDHAGAVVGHVSVLAPRPGWDTDAWVAATGVPGDHLAAVGVLVVDPASAGRGIGRDLLGTAVDHARGLGRTPVLDVARDATRAVELYRRHGWQVVGEVVPPWLPRGRHPLLLMALP
ncbi:MAG: GNAT family N-acetyltransferase [Dermatophilaceae bacterium]